MTEVNRGQVAVVLAALLDKRVASDSRISYIQHLVVVWSKGMLGAVGDWVFEMGLNYRDEYHELLNLDTLKNMIEEVNPKYREVLDYYLQYAGQADVCSDGQFHHAISRLEKAWGQNRFLLNLSRALTIYQRGVKVKGKVIKGYLAAKLYLARALRQLEEKGKAGEYDNLRNVDTVLVESANTQTMSGIKYGFGPFDELTGGGQFGELALVAGYTGEGKSQFLVNVVWDVVVNQQKNVVVYNGEMMPLQYKRRLVCRHSHHPKFDIPGGLAYDDIKFGRLDASQKIKLEEVITDLKECPDYGKMFIHGIGSTDHAGSICSSVESLSSSRIDMVVVDYLGLVPPAIARRGRREELSETIRVFKKYAQNAYNGDGIYVLAAFQTSRAGRERAEENGFYDLRALEETAEAEKAADTIVWLLRTIELEETHEIRCGVMKARDSASLSEFYLCADFASCYLTDVSE